MERIEIKNDVRWKMKDISVSKYVDLPNTGGVPNGIKAKIKVIRVSTIGLGTPATK